MTDMDRIARENNAIIIYPQGFGDSWNFRACCDPAREEGIDDFGFIRTLALQTIDNFPIDSDRVYSTGWSNGCAMSQALANEESDLITAVACMSMYFSAKRQFKSSRNIKNIVFFTVLFWIC